MNLSKSVPMIHFREIDRMPEIPRLPVPDYRALNRQFREALLDPANEAFRINPQNGHPNFGAYLQSGSNEMVTWGILAIGEWLCGRDTGWIAPTYGDFFQEELGLYLNSPGTLRVEYWYLFYVNTLAGSVFRTLYAGDQTAAGRMARTGEALHTLARRVEWDFNDQGFDFARGERFTVKDIYRQPDSIAGYAYNLLFAARNAGYPEGLEESVRAVRRYLAMDCNPWYEIPNGSAGLMAAAWLDAHGYPADVQKAAGWVFDREAGPLQTGMWGKEEINGLMMGWRGDTRAMAEDSAYSMETLMPMQFLLPAVRYCPQLADAVAKYALNVLANFQLFYGKGTESLYETKSELNPAVPYEKLERERDGHTPAACGDFWGHRSVYGAGYLYWMEAMALPAGENLFAYDLSVTDWLAVETLPVFLLRNPSGESRGAAFTPAEVWKRKCPGLYRDGILHGDVWDLGSGALLAKGTDTVWVPLEPGEVSMVAVLPCGVRPETRDGMLWAGGAELCRASS